LTISWKIVPDATLYWKVWNDQCVVFNSASGETHLLDPIPALLIRQLAAGLSDTEELVVETARLLDLEVTPLVQQTFLETLRKLDALGLIEAAAA
jgi:PqqD family protein of HPr-rel-A system